MTNLLHLVYMVDLSGCDYALFRALLGEAYTEAIQAAAFLTLPMLFWPSVSLFCPTCCWWRLWRYSSGPKQQL